MADVEVDGLPAATALTAADLLHVKQGGIDKQAALTVLIALLGDLAPSLLNTIDELAAAIGDDPNFATTMTTALAAKAADVAVVHNTGAETIAGVKTFLSSPIVPDPTTAQQAASRAFVLANAGTTPDADAITKGKLQLAGDLAGTAAAPTVPGKVPYPTAAAPANLSTAGPLIPSPGASSLAIKESVRLPYTSSLTSTNKTGQVVNLVGVTLQPDGTMPYPKGWLGLGDSNLDYIHLLSKLDCAGQPVIDTNFFGNSEGLYNPRLSQALDSTVTGYDALTVGISSMPAAGVGYTNALDRLVFNSGQTTANSKATFKNLGSVELLSDTMALKFGATGDTSLARSVATGSAGVLATGDLAASGLLQAAGNLQTGSGNLVASANVAFAMYANNNVTLPVATFANTSGTPTGNFSFQTAGGVTPTLVLSAAGTATNAYVTIAPKGTGGVNIGTASTHKVGFYGAAAVAQQTGTPAAATDAATTQALVNDIRTKLLALGLVA